MNTTPGTSIDNAYVEGPLMEVSRFDAHFFRNHEKWVKALQIHFSDGTRIPERKIPPREWQSHLNVHFPLFHEQSFSIDNRRANVRYTFHSNIKVVQADQCRFSLCRELFAVHQAGVDDIDIVKLYRRVQ